MKNLPIVMLALVLSSFFSGDDSRKIKERLNLLEADSDNDGVSDKHDKEPDTPEGYLVYGGGQAVDDDMDGVPDNIDEDPYSTRGAIVDSTGRELDDDVDGVPNSKDLEPSSKPGAFVNFQGISLKESKVGGSAIPDKPTPTYINHGGHASVHPSNGQVASQSQAQAQAQNPPPSERNVPDKTAIQETKPLVAKNEMPVSESRVKNIQDSLVLEFNKSSTKSAISQLNYTDKVYEWQLFSSKLIFSMVLLIVIVGIFFSWIQFRQVTTANNGAKNVSEVTESLNTQMEISKDKVTINSSVLGLMILVLSLVFFYLYLVYVYPIEIVKSSEDKEKIESEH